VQVQSGLHVYTKGIVSILISAFLLLTCDQQVSNSMHDGPPVDGKVDPVEVAYLLRGGQQVL
jgi:hypothetical protein